MSTESYACEKKEFLYYMDSYFRNAGYCTKKAKSAAGFIIDAEVKLYRTENLQENREKILTIFKRLTKREVFSLAMCMEAFFITQKKHNLVYNAKKSIEWALYH